MTTEVFVLKTADVVFAAGNDLEQELIVWIKEIESSEGSVVVFGWPGKFLELTVSRTGILDGGNEFEISAIRCAEMFAQGRKTVDRFLHGSPLGFSASIAMFYLTVVFEKGNVVDGGLNTEDERELVVHLDRHRSHGVFDAGAFNANVKAVSHFVLIVAVEFAAKKSGDVVGFDGVDSRSCQIIVNGSQVSLFFKDHVRGIFCLVDAPMIGESKMFVDRTKAAGKLIQFPMNTASLPAVGNPLSPFPIADFGEGIVDQFMSDSLSAQLQRQPVVPVAVDLQPAGQPGWYPDVAKSQFFINQIKVVVQALALIWFQKGLAALLVVPWFESRAGFHGRKDPNESRMISTFSQHFLNPVFLRMNSISIPWSEASFSAFSRS